jgi:hypothetical protein
MSAAALDMAVSVLTTWIVPPPPDNPRSLAQVENIIALAPLHDRAVSRVLDEPRIH